MIKNIYIKRLMPRPSTKFASRYFCFQKGKIKAIEIGTYEGDNATSIVKLLKPKEMICIDPYEEYTADTYNKKLLENAKFKALKDVHYTSFTEGIQYKFIYKKSEDAVKMIKDNSVDFIYIDGNHEYEFVKKDIELYYPKLKKGGIIAGHDIIDGPGVFKAVSEFSVKNKLDVYTEYPDWWIVK